MFTNAQEFGRALDAFVTVTIPELFKAMMAKLATTAFPVIVSMTPRDTGFAQAGWNVAINDATDFLPPTGAESYPAADLSRVTQALRGLRFGDSVLIYSNVLWIVKLNEGSSDRAPAHFVEAALETAIALLGELK